MTRGVVAVWENPRWVSEGDRAAKAASYRSDDSDRPTRGP
jgi:hypothetical protein